MIKVNEGKDNKKVINAFMKLPAETERQMRRGMYISGKMLTSDLKKNITKRGRSGKVYQIYRGLGGRLLKKPRRHQASTPSELPAVISGDYRASIGFKVLGSSKMEFGSGGNNKARNYSDYLEDRNQPLGKTVTKLGSQVNANIYKEINNGMKKFNINVKKI